jgi:hypothetical protein
MIWLLLAISICAVVILAGRAHSRYLDRLEAKSGVVVQIQLLGVSPDVVKQIESGTGLAPETSHQIPIDSFSGILVVNQACVGPPEAENRSLDYEIRLISDEGEILETYDLREAVLTPSQTETRKASEKWKKAGEKGKWRLRSLATH